MPHRRPFSRHRPHWWPENESWPPAKSPSRHNPFFRRLGCLFGVFNLLGCGLFVMLIAFIARGFGLELIDFSFLLQWALPVSLSALVLAVAIVILAVFGLRRISIPLDDLLEAAGRVAEGDYSTRVQENGPPEVRSLARAFNVMASRLYLADEQRRNLLADATHELRTPLTVIQGNLEGMLDGVYPSDEANLRALLEETTVLSRLLDDLRTLALAESGALQLKKEPTDLLPFLRDSVSAFQPQADAAGVTLSVKMADYLRMLKLDPGRIRQVLSNLLANALHYSSAGGTVSVTCELSGENILLSVEDDGPGIPTEDLPHVFERFYKSADSGGMGLGLAIAKHLVDAHGGSIVAESAPGKGTTIRIVLPIVE